MERDSSPDRLSFLDCRLPGAFRRRIVRIEPARSLAYVGADWEGAIVVVEQGVVEVECQRGGSRTFGAGAVVFMDGLNLRAMHNRGSGPVVLSAVSRAPP